MKKYDMAIISSYHQEILAADWFFNVKALNRTCLIITPNPNEFVTLSKQGVDVVYLGPYFPEKIPSISAIIEYFAQLGIDDLKDFVATEKSYYQQSDRHLFKYAYKYCVAYDKLFKEFKINTALHTVQGGEVLRRAASMIASRNSMNVIYLGETFIPKTVNLYSDEYRTVLKPQGVREMSEDNARQLIEDKINRKPVVYYETEKRQFINTPLFTKFYRLLRDGNWNIIRAYFMRKKVLFVDYIIRETYTRLAGTFKPFDPGQKYFYLPFNVDAESELFIRNSQFSDQVSLVARLSKALPKGYKLYVKTHPGREGHLAVSSYRRLSKLTNVVALPSKVNSFDVVKSSQGVVMVSSTVGLESYIMGKPTCVVGWWPYVVYGNFIKSTPEQAFQALLENKKQNDPVKFVQNVYRDTIDGTFYGGSEELKTLIKNLFAKVPYLSEKTLIKSEC
jgi:hypothetical protein